MLATNLLRRDIREALAKEFSCDTFCLSDVSLNEDVAELLDEECWRTILVNFWKYFESRYALVALQKFLTILANTRDCFQFSDQSVDFLKSNLNRRDWDRKSVDLVELNTMLRTIAFAFDVSSDHDTLAEVLKSYRRNALLTIFDSIEEDVSLN